MADSKPKPYSFCTPHMRPDYGPNRCNLCFGPVANPINDEPVHKVNSTIPYKVGDVIATTEGPRTVIASGTSEPALTDPDAQKIVEAAHSFARAKEAVKIITEQVIAARELLEALETKLKETIEIANAAQNELRQATVKSA